MVEVAEGICYFWQRGGVMREHATGTIFILAGEAGACFRASGLSRVTLRHFWVDPGRLGGVLSLVEQVTLKKAAANPSQPARILPPSHAIARRWKTRGLRPGEATWPERLQMVELFAAGLEAEGKAQLEATETPSDGRDRLRRLLRGMAADELMEASLGELAPKMQCSARHLSRLFRAELGASFRQKQNELRLAKACRLLATSDAKLLDVALTSGFNSSSPFSLLFKKRFGLSPGQWRQRHGQGNLERAKCEGGLPV